MAKGRMLNRTVSASAKFHELPDETCRLLATWIIPWLDHNGVFYGDPALVKSYVLPRRADVTIEQVHGYLNAMQGVGLIYLFESDGQTWQAWPGFLDNQVGLKPRREGKSICPPPPDNLKTLVRSSSGLTPAEKKGKEEKGKEENRSRSGAHAFDAPPNGDIAGDEAASVAVALSSPQVKLWQLKCGKPLRPQQVLDIYATAKDEARLEKVLAYWLGRGWGDENVPGILDLYVNWDIDIRNPANSKGKTAQEGQLTGAAKAAEQTFAQQQAGIAMAREYMEREGNNGNFWTN